MKVYASVRYANDMIDTIRHCESCLYFTGVLKYTSLYLMLMGMGFSYAESMLILASLVKTGCKLELICCNKMGYKVYASARFAEMVINNIKGWDEVIPYFNGQFNFTDMYLMFREKGLDMLNLF